VLFSCSGLQLLAELPRVSIDRRLRQSLFARACLLEFLQNWNTADAQVAQINSSTALNELFCAVLKAIKDW
tara:strand:- start:2040 stop:2252 length:213 start_codon:yes stop_codon:yes gene_type:complete